VKEILKVKEDPAGIRSNRRMKGRLCLGGPVATGIRGIIPRSEGRCRTFPFIELQVEGGRRGNVFWSEPAFCGRGNKKERKRGNRFINGGGGEVP